VRGVLGLAVAVVLTLSACGDDSASDPAGPPATPSASTTPSASVSTPPSDPQPVDLVAGRVVRGGAGPCYGVETDDGRLYAVHSTSAGELAVGTTVLVKTGPPTPGVDCGEGQPVTGVRVDVVS
jgi:hypothetical protein